MNVNGTSEIHFDLNEQVNRIIDPNGAGAQVIESGGHTTVSETGVDDQYEIALTQQPTANVTVTLSSPDGELTAVDDANPSNPFLTFTAANWHVPQSVRVSAVDDLEEEAFHRASVFHISSSTDPVYQDAGMPRVIVNIFDDEFGGVVTIPSDGSTDVVEGGAGDTYDIVLTMQPTQEVTISFRDRGQSGYRSRRRPPLQRLSRVHPIEIGTFPNRSASPRSMISLRKASTKRTSTTQS